MIDLIGRNSKVIEFECRNEDLLFKRSPKIKSDLGIDKSKGLIDHSLQQNKRKMKNNKSIRRIVPNIYSNDVEKSKQFYTEFLEMELVMNMEWILTFASKENPTAQISIFQNDKNKPLDNTAIFISIEVSDVDNLYQRAKKQNIEIVYPITDEPWGVRRFFVKDPNGVTINLLTH